MIGPFTDLAIASTDFEVAVGCDREAGLDHVDPEARELFRDLELLGDVERNTGRLFAVSQCRVEDSYRVHRNHLGAGSVFAATKNPPARGSEGGTREHLSVPALRKEEAQVLRKPSFPYA